MVKKTLIILAIFIMIGVILIMPLVDGIFFKKNYINFINIINKEQLVKISLLEYRQGWFNSYAKLHVDFTDKSLSNLPSFNADENITHGPIVYDPTRKVFRYGYADIESNMYTSNQSAIKIGAIAQMDGDWFIYFTIPTLDLSLPNIGRFYIDKLNGSFKIFVNRNSIRHIKIAFETGTLLTQIDAKNSYIKLIHFAPIKYLYDARRDDSEMWDGSATLNTPTIVISRTDGSTIVLDDFAMDNTFSISQGIFYSNNIAIVIQNAKVDLTPFIPFLSSLKILISANNVDTKAINDYIGMFESNASKEISKLSYQKITSFLPEVITKESVFSVKATSITPLGKVLFFAKTTRDTDAPLPNTMTDLVNNSNTKMFFRVSSSLANRLIGLYNSGVNAPNSKIALGQTNQTNIQNPVIDNNATQTLINNMLFLGYFTKDKDDYITTITFENGVCKINSAVECPKELFTIPSPTLLFFPKK